MDLLRQRSKAVKLQATSVRLQGPTVCKLRVDQQAPVCLRYSRDSLLRDEK